MFSPYSLGSLVAEIMHTPTRILAGNSERIEPAQLQGRTRFRKKGRVYLAGRTLVTLTTLVPSSAGGED